MPEIPMPTREAPVAPLARRGRNAAVLIAAGYVIVGLAWIVGSDWFVAHHVGSGAEAVEELTYLQTTKECAFIVVTGLLFYYLMNRNLRAIHRAQVQMHKRQEGIAKQYEMLFQASPSAMLIYTPGTLMIRAANDVSLPLFGYSREELLAMTCIDLLVEEERPRALANANNPQGGAQTHGIWQCRRRDRRIIFVEISTHDVEFDAQPAGIVQAIDVTERLRAERSLEQHRSQLEQRVADRTTQLSVTNKELQAEVDERHRVEAELRAATAAAKAANNAKSTFLANTSHEIRTPLTSILGYADLLSDDELSEDTRSKYLAVVQQNAQHLLALIDDLLDLSRAEMGKVRVIFDDHPPREIAQQAIELLRPRAAAKNLALTLRFEGSIPDTIRTDGVRVRQILLNLLSNAIKFTSRGYVALIVRGPATADDGERSPIRFEVRDSGIGMAPEHAERVFEPFYQVDQGVTRRYGGSGLGLAISQQLAQQMGGALSVESSLGEGSVFALELPVEREEMGEIIETKPKPLQGEISGTILLAEDNPNIRLLVEEYLRRAGARVIATADGAQAVEAIEQSLATGAAAIDLVLLDLHMPVLDGGEALKRIRRAGFGGPIVGLTADYAEKTTDEWNREGWDAMAAKPIDRQAFIPLLARMMAGSAIEK